jgi:uncharacterized cupredoxin-like copper-binding protein
MRLALLGMLAGALLFTAACGGDDEKTSTATATRAAGTGTSGSPAAGVINVTLREYSITPDPTSAKAGKITFKVENKGPSMVHEFLVIKTDLDIDQLPTQSDGALDEEGSGVELVDELPEFKVGEIHELTVDLEAGKYVLACNVGEETGGHEEIHFKNGMHTAFTVQ